jgi:hypothetical protein
MTEAGVFSNHFYILSHIIFAVKRGYIPIVDMKYYISYYNEALPVNGTSNAWEYYFLQPSGYSLEDVYKSAKVILCEMTHLDKFVPFPFSFYKKNKKISFFNEYVSKYMRFQPSVISAVDKLQTGLFGEKKNILGVMSRSTMFNVLFGHNTVPEIDELIEKTKILSKDWGMEYVFLSTEEEPVVELFKNEFGDKLIMSKRRRFSTINKKIPLINEKGESARYLSGLEYIIDTILLSRCDSVICPVTSGSMAALILNNNRFAYKYIFDLGINHSKQTYGVSG